MLFSAGATTVILASVGSTGILLPNSSST